MMQWFAKSFEKFCGFGASLNFIFFAIIGGIVGKVIGNIIYNDSIIFLFVIFGLIGGFFVNVLTFGFIAQIIEIRRSLTELERKFCETKKDDLLEPKEENWFCAECGTENVGSNDNCTKCGAKKSKIMV